MHIQLPITSVASVAQFGTVGQTDACEPCETQNAAPACQNVSVYVDGASIVNYAPEEPTAQIDVVLSVSIAEGAGITKTYKLVKRIAFDKVALASQACNTEAVMVESEDDPAQIAKEDAEFMSARRAREIAGIVESRGNKVFKVTIKYEDADGASCSTAFNIDAVRDAAHARHVATIHNLPKYKNAKIVRTAEIKPKDL